MQFRKMRLQGLVLIEPGRAEDARGFFLERYRHADYAAAGIDCSFIQDNEVFSKSNVLRGLHYQEKPGQAKLVSAVSGLIWDVAVDIRPSSPTYGQWEAVELSEENGLQFYIPIGFAHGYCVLSPTARVYYKVSAPYDPKEERTLRWDDPHLAIDWPLNHPLLSERDRSAPFFQENVSV